MRVLRILVADDEPTNCEVASVILTALGHTVVTRSNGSEVLALCHVQGERFDVILMDILMPVMGGIEAVRRLRADVSTRDVPIVCLSAKASNADREAGFGAGCDRYLTKPYKRKDLMAVIDEVCPVT